MDRRITVAHPLVATRTDGAALLIGLICALNGILLPFVPVFLIFAYRRGVLVRSAALLALTFGVGLAPFFPASLSAWGNRAARMAIETPFWWSIYRLLPEGLYRPVFDKLLIGGVVAAFTLGYWRRRITLQDALVASVCLVTLSGVYTSVERVVPMLILLYALTRRVPLVYTLLFCLMLMFYVPLAQILNDAITRPMLLVFWLPIGFTGWLYIRYR